MINESSECARIRGRLREYALGTLEVSKTQAVESHLAGCPACAAALDVERQALTMLDGLPVLAPPQGLVEATQRRIRLKASEKPGFEWARNLWAAAAVTCIALVVAAVILPALRPAREAARRSFPQDNLKQFAVVLKMYAEESRDGLYPPLAPYEGMWVPDLRVLYPEFLNDPNILVNPSLYSDLHKDFHETLHREPKDWEKIHRIVAQTFTYTGWVLQNDADVKAFAAIPERVVRDPAIKELKVGDKTFYRMREGIERYLITDINNAAASHQNQAAIPVVFENVATADKQHQPAGCNVSYMDGHVSYIRMGKDFPVNTAVAQAFPAPPLNPPKK